LAKIGKNNLSSKIKYTKNELKTQRDALTRFTRYLPTLMLKKQQLQVELRSVKAQIAKKEVEEEEARMGLSVWVKLFSEPFNFLPFIQVVDIQRSTSNIAGITIPIFEKIQFVDEIPDWFETLAWVDRGIETLRYLIRLRVERQILREQHRLLAEELRITSQRVNLFEKVKIPQCRENIRIIRIFMGDQQTAAVACSKIAKSKNVEKICS
jgi:V/A-type H+/Na+-transporting ATPase subunit D